MEFILDMYWTYIVFRFCLNQDFQDYCQNHRRRRGRWKHRRYCL